jgi:hypothetical protein
VEPEGARGRLPRGHFGGPPHASPESIKNLEGVSRPEGGSKEEVREVSKLFRP